jgi:hypothetical protein
LQLPETLPAEVRSGAALILIRRSMAKKRRVHRKGAFAGCRLTAKLQQFVDDNLGKLGRSADIDGIGDLA